MPLAGHESQDVSKHWKTQRWGQTHGFGTWKASDLKQTLAWRWSWRTARTLCPFVMKAAGAWGGKARHLAQLITQKYALWNLQFCYDTEIAPPSIYTGCIVLQDPGCESRKIRKFFPLLEFCPMPKNRGGYSPMVRSKEKKNGTPIIGDCKNTQNARSTKRNKEE